MIIDDEEAILDALQLVLEARGYSARTVVRPEEFEHALQEFEPTVIFVDLSMPGMDGSTVVKKLKSNTATCHIPVVVISAHTDVEERALDAGAEGYLEKPFRIDDFLKKVDSLSTSA